MPSCQKRVQYVCIGNSPDSHEVANGIVICTGTPLAGMQADNVSVAPAGAPPCQACQAKHKKPQTTDADVCERCGALNRPDAKQCHVCGAPASTPD